MNSNILFATPCWHIQNQPVPEGAVEWALEFPKNNPGQKQSNRGGYQSQYLPFYGCNFPYEEHIKNLLAFFPSYIIKEWWLNISGPGDYNVKHNHPDSDLALIWYITDNYGTLRLDDPNGFTRINLYKAIGGEYGYTKGLYAKAGDMIIFPSDIDHFVEPYADNKPKISVAMNLCFTGDMESLRNTLKESKILED